MRPNVEMRYEVSYQYMNLDREDLGNAASGGYTRFAIVPTFKPMVGGLGKRPEIRFFVACSDWDDELNDDSADDDFGSDGFTGSEWGFGVQTEIWFYVCGLGVALMKQDALVAGEDAEVQWMALA